MVERWILAALRNRKFFSLDELNTAIATLLEQLNHCLFRKLPGSPQSAFEVLDRPALRPLPEQPYVCAERQMARVHIDYHVEVVGHYYSVHYQLVKKQLEVRLTARTVECFHPNQRVASHLRSPHKGRNTIQAEHMPKSHREHAEWTPQRLIRDAQTGEEIDNAGHLRLTMHPCVAARRLPVRMIVEQVPGSAWAECPNGVESAPCCQRRPKSDPFPHKNAE